MKQETTRAQSGPEEIASSEAPSSFAPLQYPVVLSAPAGLSSDMSLSGILM